jgi:hypothetical protein
MRSMLAFHLAALAIAGMTNGRGHYPPDHFLPAERKPAKPVDEALRAQYRAERLARKAAAAAKRQPRKGRGKP